MRQQLQSAKEMVLSSKAVFHLSVSWHCSASTLLHRLAEGMWPNLRELRLVTNLMDSSDTVKLVRGMQDTCKELRALVIR